MEALLGRLPGAEDFLSAGPPWWFDWFLAIGTNGHGVPADVRDAFVAAYTGTEASRCAFEHYRAMPMTAHQIAAATNGGALSMPVLAVGAQPVGPALYQQLRGVAKDLSGRTIAECGHIIPLDRPGELSAVPADFLH